MKTIFAAAGFLITLASAHAASAATIRVIDGDTVVISVDTIRILDMDTPKIHHAQATQNVGLAWLPRVGLRCCFLPTGERSPNSR